MAFWVPWRFWLFRIELESVPMSMLLCTCPRPRLGPPIESYRARPPPAALMEAMGKFVQKSLKEGTLVDTGGLLPSSAGFRIRLESGKLTTMDGPFSESKEVIGGWAILNTESPEEALRVATE